MNALEKNGCAEVCVCSAMKQVRAAIEPGGTTEVSSAHNYLPERATLETTALPSHDVFSGASEGSGEEEVTIRQWLSRANRDVDSIESLHIFKQVLDFVDLAHQQGVMLRNIRPSCFLLSPFSRVAFIDSASTRGSSDQSFGNSTEKASTSLERRQGEDAAGRRRQTESLVDQRVVATGSSRVPIDGGEGRHRIREGVASAGWLPEWSGSTGSDEDTLAGSRVGRHSAKMDSSSGKRIDGNDVQLRISEDCFPQRQLLQMEQAWYTSPEELATGTGTFASDIYSLGVLIFEVFVACQLHQVFQALHEFNFQGFPVDMIARYGVHPVFDTLVCGLCKQLFCSFGSEVERARVMADLRHRILPPRLLSERPKEASFCLWLLHPEPSSRPKAR